MDFMFKLDLPLSVIVLLIILFGLLIHFSLSTQSFNLHLIYLSLGILFALAVSTLDTKALTPFTWHIYAFSLLLLLVTLVVGATTRGSTRWIDIGFFRFQPSEFVKPLVILAFAQFLAKTDITQLKNVLKMILLFSLPTILVFLQPDLGTAGIFTLTFFGMLFTAGLRFRHILIFLVVFSLATPVFWHSLQDYQQSRIMTFLHPEDDPRGAGYNAIQSVIAIGSGKLTGRGLGHGTQSKLRFLPEYKTDFVFASLAEELGLLGSSLLLLFFTLMIWRLFILAQNASSTFTYLSIIGIALMFSSQIFINIGMNLGLLPITGITLPFISSGGSSIITSLISLGLVTSLSQSRDIPIIEII